MGYAQELERRLSRFSNFAISFSIICILSGGINSLAQATSALGGTASASAGWSDVPFPPVSPSPWRRSASAYPTAGGLYHWGSILGNRFTGWVTAWLNLLGLITVLGAINVGTWTSSLPAPSGPRSVSTDTSPIRRSSWHDHRRPGADQPSWHPPDGPAHRLLRLAHPRRPPGLIATLSRSCSRRALGFQPALYLHQLLR